MLDRAASREFYTADELTRIREKMSATPLCNVASGVYTRIGSASARAQVYMYNYGFGPKGLSMAMKVLLYTDDSSEQSARVEIELAAAASDLVTRGVSPFFPGVFYHTSCPAITLPDFTGSSGQELKVDALNYSRIKAIVAAVTPSSLRKITRVYLQRHQPMPEKIASLASYQNALVDVERNPPPIEGSLLFSELFWGDLKTYFEVELPTLSIVKAGAILCDVLRAINDMQDHLGISHHDLHLGNILINPDQPPPNIAIHDFGEAQPLTDLNRFDDFNKFIDSIIMPFRARQNEGYSGHSVWPPVVAKIRDDYEYVLRKYRGSPQPPSCKVVSAAFMNKFLRVDDDDDADADAENVSQLSNALSRVF